MSRGSWIFVIRLIDVPLIDAIGQRPWHYSTRVAVSIGSGPNRDIWILDLARGTPVPVTSGPGLKYTQAWSPTGDRLVFSASRGGPLQLYQKALTGSGQEDLLVAEDTTPKQAQSWSSDGSFLLYMGIGDKTAQDLWICQ